MSKRFSRPLKTSSEEAMNLLDSILEFIRRDVEKVLARPKSHKVIFALIVLTIIFKPLALIVIPGLGLYGLYVILEDYFGRPDQ
jgi:hypothetical protein